MESLHLTDCQTEVVYSIVVICVKGDQVGYGKTSRRHEQIVEGISLTHVGAGGAYWYGRAQTEDGDMFVKVPYMDKGGGHDCPWKEFIVGRLASRAGIPTLRPMAVQLNFERIPSQWGDNVYQGAGEVFCGTAWTALKSSAGYDNLSSTTRALLYVFDNLVGNGDRAGPDSTRCDCWDSELGPLITDWDLCGLSNDPRYQRATLGWSCSTFLAIDLRSRQIQAGCESLEDSLSDEDIRSVVANAVICWPHLDAELQSRWLIGRRNRLTSELLGAIKKGVHPWRP